MTRRTFIDLHPVELNYYPFIISLDKCNGICHVADDLTTKRYVWSKSQDVNIKAFKMITVINEVKTIVKHISWIFW